jgi:hypothetical protein
MWPDRVTPVSLVGTLGDLEVVTPPLFATPSLLA